MNLPVTRNIDLPPTLISRFDLLYLVLDEVNEALDRKLAQHLVSLYIEDNPETGGEDILVRVSIPFCPLPPCPYLGTDQKKSRWTSCPHTSPTAARASIQQSQKKPRTSSSSPTSSSAASAAPTHTPHQHQQQHKKSASRQRHASSNR